MFRENVLTKDEIIRRIAETMVPVALDYQTLRDASSREAEFLLPLMKQRDQEQGVWIFAPDGNALGGFVGFGNMVGQMRTVIEGALAAFGGVEPRQIAPSETHPHRGKGTLPDGGVCLAEYLVSVPDALKHMNAKSPVVSSVELTEEEFAAFMPDKPVVGFKWTIPETAARKLCRITSPLCYQHAPQPDWVTEVRIDAEVVDVRIGAARIVYEGRIASAHEVGSRPISMQAIELVGEGVLDVRMASLESLLLVGEGRLVWPEAPEKEVEFEALVEWEEVREVSTP